MSSEVDVKPVAVQALEAQSGHSGDVATEVKDANAAATRTSNRAESKEASSVTQGNGSCFIAIPTRRTSAHLFTC